MFIKPQFPTYVIKLHTFIPVHGNWTDYGDWGACSADCGGGNQTRSRTCTNPTPDHGGDKCEGVTDETQTCNERPCPGQLVFYWDILKE